jgi:hypothetical protein
MEEEVYFENDSLKINQLVYTELRILYEEADTAVKNIIAKCKRIATLLFNSLKPGQQCDIVDITNLLMEFMDNDMKALFKRENKTVTQSKTVMQQKKKNTVYAHRILDYMKMLQQEDENV